MIYTLTLNPSLDYIVTVDHFVLGATNRTSKDIIFPGGKGINVSIVLRNFGFDTKALGFTAGFTGVALKGMVEEAGISAEFIDVPEGFTRINVKMRGETETEVNGIGPNITEKEIAELYTKLDTLTSEDILIISGSIPNSLPQTLYMEIMQHLQDKNIRIIVDATKDLLMNVLPYHPFLIKPNNHELEELFDTHFTDLSQVEECARKLQEKGARNVLVSMGGDGALLVDENGQVYTAGVPKGKLKNSVGAGDSMVAGFLAGYLETGSYQKAFEYGVCTGSASAFSENLATRAEVEKLLADNTDIFKK